MKEIKDAVNNELSKLCYYWDMTIAIEIMFKIQDDGN